VWRGVGPRGKTIEHQGEVEDLGRESGVEVELVVEVAPSPRLFHLPPPFDALDSQLQHVTHLLEQLGQNHHYDHNKIISFMNDLQRNQWNIQD